VNNKEQLAHRRRNAQPMQRCKRGGRRKVTVFSMRSFADIFAWLLKLRRQPPKRVGSTVGYTEGQMYDEYAEAQKLSVMLRDEGFEMLAQSLLDDIAGGATSTEILSNLGLHLRQFLATPAAASSQSVSVAKELYRHIDKKLK